MKIYGTAKGGAIGKKDFGVAFGGAAAALPYPDSLGVDANSTSVNGATLNEVSEILGTGCFSFDGTNDTCVLPNDLDAMLSGAFTWSGWCYAAAADTGSSQITIISKPATTSWTEPLYHSFTVTQLGTNFLFTSNNQSTYVTLSNAVGGTGWHNLVVTKTSGNLFSFYVDDDTPVTATHASTWGTQPWTIGNTPYNTRYWDSYIDDMVFLKRVITSDEIESLYNSGNGNLASTLDHDDIIAYYTFDDLTLPNSAVPIE